ncbi:MAG TPA: hypothetical protein HA224_02005 [Nanoarchaeota archaeon]|nr:hypothetical protein [Nanoarchaeota archaeon]
MEYLAQTYELLQSAGQWAKANPVKTTVIAGLAGFGLTALLVPDVQHVLAGAYDYVNQLSAAREQRFQECMAAQAEKGLSGALAESNCGAPQLT